MNTLCKIISILFLLIFSNVREVSYAQRPFEKWTITPEGYFLTSNLNAKSDVRNNYYRNFTDSLLFYIPNVAGSRIYVFDINKDGDNEIIVSVQHQTGVCKIYAFDREGISLPNFPFQIPRITFASINLYDSILVASYVSVDNDNAYFLGINSLGQLVIPEVQAGENMWFSKDPVVADITGDGKEEIIFFYANGLPSEAKSDLIFYDPSKPEIIAELSLPYSQVTPAIGDIDGDSINEVIHETGFFWDDHVLLWAFKGDATVVDGFPKNVSNTTIFAGVQLADYLGDSRPEIILQLSDYPDDFIKLLSPEGDELMVRYCCNSNWTGPPLTAFGRYSENLYPIESPILTIIRGEYIYYIDIVSGLNESVLLSLSPCSHTTYRTIAADTSVSNLFSVVVQTGRYEDYSKIVFLINKDKQIVEQINFSSTEEPQIFDLENDGHLDVLYSYDDSFFIIPNLCEYDPQKTEWPYEKHDPGRTSNYNYNGAIIPVEFISFKAEVLGNVVELNWSTATETNNSGFEVHRKKLEARSQKSDWENIGFVPGFGTTTEPKSYSFSDEDVTTGTYKYRLKQIDFDGAFTYSNEIEVEVDFTPKEFVLYQNYPNPFNPNTVIKFEIPSVIASEAKQSHFVTLKVYDILGNEVVTLVNEEKQPGVYEVELNSHSGEVRNLTSGIYFYQLKAGSFTNTKKMILAK